MPVNVTPIKGSFFRVGVFDHNSIHTMYDGVPAIPTYGNYMCIITYDLLDDNQLIPSNVLSILAIPLGGDPMYLYDYVTANWREV